MNKKDLDGLSKLKLWLIIKKDIFGGINKKYRQDRHITWELDKQQMKEVILKYIGLYENPNYPHQIGGKRNKKIYKLNKIITNDKIKDEVIKRRKNKLNASILLQPIHKLRKKKMLEELNKKPDILKRISLAREVKRIFLETKIVKSAMNNKSVRYQIKPNMNNNNSILTFVKDANRYILIHIKKKLRDEGGLKIQAILKVQIEKQSLLRPEKSSLEKTYLSTKQIIIQNELDIQNFIKDLAMDMVNKFENFQGKGSGWVMGKIEYLDIITHKYTANRGSSYIELDDYLKNKKALVNIKNEDNECFKWCITRDMLNKYNEENNLPESKNQNRVDNNLKEFAKNNLKFDDITYPVKIGNDMNKVCDMNHITIFVFSYNGKNPKENERIQPLWKPKDIRKRLNEDGVTFRNPVYLLLIEDVINKNNHYVLIKDFDKLFADSSKNQHKKFTCVNCLVHKSSAKCLKEHYQQGCLENDPCMVKLPKKEDAYVEFSNYKNKQNVPFYVIADLESVLGSFTTLDDTIQFAEKTIKENKHTACSYSYKVTCENPELFPEFDEIRTYRGEKPIEHLLESLTKDGIRIKEILKKEAKMVITNEQNIEYKNSNNCHICEKSYTEPLKNVSNCGFKSFFEDQKEKGFDLLKTLPDDEEAEDDEEDEDEYPSNDYIADPIEYYKLLNKRKRALKKIYNTLAADERLGWEEDATIKACVKVRDHDHITGKYRGSAHQSCNVNFNLKNFKLPVFFHNLQGYDSHHIIDKMKGKIGCIPLNKEKVLSFWNHSIKFVDSFAFLPSSLDTLAKNLPVSKFKNVNAFLDKKYPHLSEKHRDLIKKKGGYPYSYMDSTDKFDEEKLPKKKCFFNKLTNTPCSRKDYEHAEEVWRVFGMKTLGDYHDLYLNTDVLLLADILQNFKETAIKKFKLDPFWYITLPGYSWDCMQYITKVKIQLFDDTQEDMHSFMEKAIRGGICMIMDRYAKANNKYMGKSFEITDIISYLLYIDANNLYGLAMSQKLPLNDFKWNTDIWDMDKIMSISADSDIGYFFEVDKDYPNHLHDKHQYYPCAVEKMKITEDMLSPYQKMLHKKLELSNSNVSKLVPNLQDKKKYIVHYRNLQLYLDQGLVLTKVHRVLEFHQEEFLKPYVDLNTQYRTEAKNDFEKDFFKLMNNAMFGKGMENVRNRINFEIVTVEDENNRSRYSKLINSYKFKDTKFFGTDDKVGIESYKTKVVLNKPIHIGAAVLDLSKLHMYDFHYNVMMKKYGHEKCKLLMTDTDSFVYHIETDNLYEDIHDLKDYFDLSNLPNDDKLYNKENEKVLGKFKIEHGNLIMTEFIALKAKMYSFRLCDTEGNAITREEFKDKKKFKFGGESMKAKGVKKSAINYEKIDEYNKILEKDDDDDDDNEMKKLFLSHEDYLDCYNNEKILEITQNSLRSYGHEIFSITSKKIGLNCYEDKSYYIDKNTSLRYGHYKAITHQKENKRKSEEILESPVVKKIKK